MKINLTVALDLGDEYDDFSKEELHQFIWDEYVQFVAQSHHEQAVHWFAKSKIGSDDEDLGAKLIYLMHKKWGKMTDRPKWSFEVVTPSPL